MFSFSKKLMLARLIQLEEGKILLMGLPVSIIPVSVLADMEKTLIGEVGYRKAWDKIYNGSKQGTLLYNKTFIKKFGIKKLKEKMDWQSKIVTMSGWGNVKFEKIDKENNIILIRFFKSPFTKEYGKSKYPICFIQSGFAAGGMEVSFNKEMECLETKCLAMGDPYCEFFVGPKEEIEKKRNEQWKSLGIR